MRSLRRSSSLGRVACGGECKMEEGSINQSPAQELSGGDWRGTGGASSGILWEPCSMTSLSKPMGWR